MDPKKAAQELLADIIKWRRDLHKIPEIGFDLQKTSAYIRNRLDEMRIPCHQVAETGIVALIEGAEQGPTIALRADMDALPIGEETGLPFASANSNMHACGHDAHMAILLGTAKILSGITSKLKGNIKLLFQPGEEGYGGAEEMIKAGCLESPRVDMAFGLHVGQIFPEVTTGQIGICEGPILAAATAFTMKVRGKSTHGALPHLGVDPITTTSEIILALQKIVSREVDPLNPAVLTVGKIEGGEAFNIITSEVNLCGDFRTLYESDRLFISERMKEMSKAIAEANRAEAEVEILGGYPPTVNDAEATNIIIDAAAEIIGSDNIIHIKKPNMGTEDMSLYLEKVPGAFFVLGTGNPEKGITYPHHNSKFDLDEDVLWVGTAIFVKTILDRLS